MPSRVAARETRPTVVRLPKGRTPQGAVRRTVRQEPSAGLAHALRDWWDARRRRRAAATDLEAPDPVAVLRAIIEPADGVGRSLVELLAEEDGLSRQVAEATLDRLSEDGTLRTERGPDGEEVLAWASPA